jgi:RNA polymerase-interacting CarD/CdnL/TRCF family regulator
MTDSNLPYSVDDWVVHTQYGVGQIKRIEVKPIHGEKTDCYKVKTNDCTYWFPTNDIDNPRIRSVASKDVIQKIIKNLRRKSSRLDTDRRVWKQRIEEAQADGDLISLSVIIRDLSTQKILRQLNQTEDDALEYFKDRLVREWASITGENISDLRNSLQDYIQESQSKVKVD